MKPPRAMARIWTKQLVAQWNADHPIGSRFVCSEHPDFVLTSAAPAFLVGTEAAVECSIPGQPLGGGMLLDGLACIDNMKRWSPAPATQTDDTNPDTEGENTTLDSPRGYASLLPKLLMLAGTVDDMSDAEYNDWVNALHEDEFFAFIAVSHTQESFLAAVAEAKRRLGDTDA